MKGIVFTEFMDMVDDKFGLQVSEAIVEKADLDSGGAYTAVGTYPHDEIVALILALSGETSIPVSELVKVFGKHLITRFYALFPAFFDDCATLYDFLANVDGYIHGEVRKLYPDATLPSLQTQRISKDELEIIYTSPRGMGDLAEGLIQGAIDHYAAKTGETSALKRKDMPPQQGAQCVYFVVKASRPTLAA